MEQLNNNAALAMLQTAAVQSQSQPAKASKSDRDSGFQKLMDKAASGNSKDTTVEDDPKAAETPAAEGRTEAAPVQKEDALTRIKKMLEQFGAFACQPDCPCICIDMETGETTAVYNPGEYVMVYTGEDFEMVPTIDLEPWQQAQLKQLLIDPNPIDVRDPKVDAMLEATAPGADNSPTAMLEKVVADQFGKVVNQVVDEAKAEVRPQAQDKEGGDGFQIQVTDVEQAPQRLFHDVKAAPVKVGEVEVYEAPKTETNVAKQVDMGVAQAMEKGESLVRIQLNPEHLGSVTVEISRSAEGIIHVALNAHSSETRGLLERHAGELQGLIADRTRQDVEVNVQRQQESQQGQNQQNYDGRGGHGQDGQEHRRQRRQEQSGSQDFIHQLRLGLIPAEGE